MKETITAVGLASSLFFATSAQAQDIYQNDVDLSDELTNISNEEGTAFYLKLGLGAVQFNKQSATVSSNVVQRIKFDKGFSTHAVIGKNLGEHAAIELELSRQQTNIDEDDSGRNFFSAIGSYNTAMINFVFRPNLNNVSDKINPYVGAGFGITRSKYTSPGAPLEKGEDTVKSKQYFLGNRFDLRDNYFIDAEYRYFKTDHPELISETNTPFEFDNSGSQSIIVSYGKNF